ncbi:hypothetical protein KAJ61_02175 [Candidatus Parcubacteria bacterium]|nr:hypothetical protein [Candidatus Parcubacteria bacterium]
MNKKTEKTFLGILVFVLISLGSSVAISGALMVRGIGILEGAITIFLGLALCTIGGWIILPKYTKIKV